MGVQCHGLWLGMSLETISNHLQQTDLSCEHFGVFYAVNGNPPVVPSSKSELHQKFYLKWGFFFLK